MLRCRDILEALNDYLDDSITAHLRADLEAHLAHCRTCTVVVSSTRKTVKVVTESRSFRLPREVAARIVASLDPGGGGCGSDT